jgi:hypothetical protein
MPQSNTGANIRIIGWHLEPRPEDPCDCGQPSTVLVEDLDRGDYHSRCSACVPAGTRDYIAEAFDRALRRA